MVGERVQAGLGRGRESHRVLSQRHGEKSAWGLLPTVALLWGGQV